MKFHQFISQSISDAMLQRSSSFRIPIPSMYLHSWTNPSEDTPLHIAVENNDLEMVQLLLSHGADVSTPGENGATPLNLANSIEITEILMSDNADPAAKSVDGTVAVECRSIEGSEDVYVLKNGKSWPVLSTWGFAVETGVICFRLQVDEAWSMPKRCGSGKLYIMALL